MKWRIAYLIYVLLITILSIIIMIAFIRNVNTIGSAILGIWTGAFLFRVLPDAIKFIEYE
jgi:hypothetical protein